MFCERLCNLGESETKMYKSCDSCYTSLQVYRLSVVLMYELLSMDFFFSDGGGEENFLILLADHDPQSAHPLKLPCCFKTLWVLSRNAFCCLGDLVVLDDLELLEDEGRWSSLLPGLHSDATRGLSMFHSVTSQ